MIDRRVVITLELKLDALCHKSYPASVIDVLLQDRKDERIRSWRVLAIDEHVVSEDES